MWGKHMKSIFYCGMNTYQKVNHFPGSYHLGRKDKLHVNISRLRKSLQISLDFVPQTFLLPVESKSFHKAWKKEGNVHRWIAKPVRLLLSKDEACISLFHGRRKGYPEEAIAY